jgi:predicted MPP superfamily phosphohydrolase
MYSKGVFMDTSTIVVGIILLLILWAAIEQKLIVTSKYTVKSAKLPKKFNQTSFVVLADLHNYRFGKSNQRLIKRVDALSPDFIIAAGDMINKKATCYPSSGSVLLEDLSSRYKIYYAYGNHEQRMEQLQKSFSDVQVKSSQEQRIPSASMESICSTWIKYKDRLRNKNVKILDNESTVHMKSKAKLHITGVSIGPEFFQKSEIPVMEEGYLSSLIGECSKEDFQILIAHNPVYFMDYAKWGADLTISGHLHGGLVRLPGVGGILSPQAKFFPKYHSGNHTENGKHMVVSRGLGSHSIMPRLFNIPELVYVTLIKEDK